MTYSRTVTRDTLTRAEIVRAAIKLLDAEGLEGLSMRRLGARLDSAATAVYWHIKSRDELLALAADEVWNEVPRPDPAEIGWRAAVMSMATGLYTIGIRHPWLIFAMTTHVLYGPGKARSDDYAYAVFETAGFTGREADRAVHAVAAYVLGNVLGQVADLAWQKRLRRSRGAATARMRDAYAQARKLAMEFPRLRARLESADAETPTTPAQHVAFGLELILDGLEGRLAARHKPVATTPRPTRARPRV